MEERRIEIEGGVEDRGEENGIKGGVEDGGEKNGIKGGIEDGGEENRDKGWGRGWRRGEQG